MKKIKLACIIDDDRMYVYGIKRLLQKNNFCDNIVIFKNGFEAINHLKPEIENEGEIPDLIFLDINMPVMDGWQFLDEFAKIKRKPKKITLYMVSSSIDPVDLEKAKNYPDIKDYIIKPISEANLKKLLE